MSIDHNLQSSDGATDDLTGEQSRRALLRRSLLGISGLGLAFVLTACGGDDDDDGDDELETVESEGEDAVDEVEDEGEDAVDEVEDEIDDQTD